MKGVIGMAELYIRGSEWRRWELHLHTPYTKKEDKFIGKDSDEKWRFFYSSIRDYVGDGNDPLKAICAIAITDYLSVENYLKILNENNIPTCVKLLLPNVELRLTPIASETPLNIHCIFSPDIVDQLESCFFSRLKFNYQGNDYGATKSELIRLGRSYRGDNSLREEEAHQEGLEQYVISIDTLAEVFKGNQHLRDNTIIIASNKTNDGVSGVVSHSEYLSRGVSQLDATRQTVYQLSDMIYSANPADIKYFLGYGVDDEETVKRKCGSIMPCVHGSDAHTNDKIFAPDLNRYCWIKADPTFEGLKQVLYEPKERVKISSSYPDSKQTYQKIDRVEIIDNEDFDPQAIHFSDNLTCIIGGKSTGKSLLIHNMALAIDEEQVNNKQDTVKTNVKPVSEFKVYWRDGVSSDEKEKKRKIVYIPQTYLNRLSDEREETTEIDRMIQDILLQDENIHQAFTEMNDKISDHKQTIAKTVVDFIKTVGDLTKITNSKKEIGDKDGIDHEIKKLSEQLEQMSKEYNVTEEEVGQYQAAVESVQRLKSYLRDLNKEKEVIESIESVLQTKAFPQKEISKLSDDITNAIERTQTIANNYWLDERSKIIATVDEYLTNTLKSLSEYETQVENLKPKMEGNEQIRKLSFAIVSEKVKLDKLSKLDVDLSDLQDKYDLQMNVLTNSFTIYKKFYMEYVDCINEKLNAQSEDLEFHVNWVFRTEQFSQRLLEIVNKKSISRFHEFSFEKITEDDLVPNKLRAFVEAILTNSSETLQLTKGHNVEATLRDVFSDWNNIDYVVTMDKDSIEDMSPGKKALVLLRLLISLAESKCPILIDQPEDDLDNRSIFNDLIQFIKEKKNDRQIIIVTHNANIVLGGDAELVLIANQRGKNAPNKKYRFEYRGGSIENNSLVKDENGTSQVGILNEKGIQTHVCEILEGGERAFDLRKSKYRFIK